MITLSIADAKTIWRQGPIGPLVDGLEIIQNNDTEVIVKLPLAPVISLLIKATDVTTTVTISAQVSMDGENWYDFCIIDRRKSSDGLYIIDDPKPLKIEISQDGSYSYMFDTTVKFKYMKFIQDTDVGNFDITMMVDVIW